MKCNVMLPLAVLCQQWLWPSYSWVVREVYRDMSKIAPCCDLTRLAFQHTAQTEVGASLQAEGTGSKEQEEDSEGLSSTLKQGPSPKAENTVQQPSAEANTAEQQLPAAAQPISGGSYAAPGSMPAHSMPAHVSKVAANSSSSALSPQLLLQRSDSVPHEQQEMDLPRPIAQAAEEHASDSQAQGPWQEVKTSRGKPATQQAASKPNVSKTSKQGRDTSDEEPSAQAPLRLGICRQLLIRWKRLLKLSPCMKL